MRSLLCLLLLLPACGSTRATNALCAFCDNDSQCGGNPCFADVSDQRFCGRSCDACPDGFSCATVMGTGGLAQTCFPNTESCASTMVGGTDDGGTGAVNDGGTTPGIIVAGPVGASGGTVDRLLFGITGDTRPAECAPSAYPQSIINNIFTGLKNQNVQFAVDQGDHMFNCGSGPAAVVGAQQQMANYVGAASLLGKTVFMTMGNHECSGEATTLCTLGSYGNNANYTAFMDALQPIASTPYYRFDVMTASGLAVFLVLADDVWDATEQGWLTQQLTDADARAKYTFVSKHHPDGNTDHPEFQQIYDLVTQHKYTLFLTGHSHEYRHSRKDVRTVVIGCGGAPLASGSFWGYGTVRQGTDDRIYVTVYDQATGNVQDSFDVAPQ